MMGVPTPPVRKTSTCLTPPSSVPEQATFCRLEELPASEAVGQRLEPDRAVLACRVVEPDELVPPVQVRGHPRGHADASTSTSCATRRCCFGWR